MIVEFWFDVSTLQTALSRAPEMSVEMEDMSSTDSVPLRKMFWATGGDFDAFERGLDEDPTIEDPKCLAEAEGSRLYRVTYPGELPAVEAYRAVVELDGVVLAASTQGNGWNGRIRFPDREAIAEWRDRCEAAELRVNVRAVYSQEESAPEARYGLTDQQREALLTAAASGYFSIPRETSLAGLADELGVSSQAASERLRRGMEKLVFKTLGDGDE